MYLIWTASLRRNPVSAVQCEDSQRKSQQMIDKKDKKNKQMVNDKTTQLRHSVK